MRRFYRRITLFAAVPIAILLVAGGAYFWDRRVISNRPVQFYGRVVDDQGVGIPGVVVTLHLTRNNFFSLPLPFADTNSVLHFKVVTGSEGNFSFENWRGGTVLIVEDFLKDGYAPRFINIPSAFSYNKRIDQYNPVPIKPEWRITYPLTRTSKE